MPFSGICMLMEELARDLFCLGDEPLLQEGFRFR